MEVNLQLQRWGRHWNSEQVINSFIRLHQEIGCQPLLCPTVGWELGFSVIHACTALSPINVAIWYARCLRSLQQDPQADVSTAPALSALPPTALTMLHIHAVLRFRYFGSGSPWIFTTKTNPEHACTLSNDRLLQFGSIIYQHAPNWPDN